VGVPYPRDIDGEGISEQCQPLQQPGFAVIEISAGVAILTAQERAPHAAGDAVVVGCGL